MEEYSKAELKRALNPEEGNTINWSVLGFIQEAIKKAPLGKVGRAIIDKIELADFYDTETFKILSKYLVLGGEKDDPEKIKIIVKIVDDLIKRRPLRQVKESNVKAITAKLDALANELEESRPELALAIDLINDKLEKMTSIPADPIKKLHQEYKTAGGAESFDNFLSNVVAFFDDMKLDGKDIAEWDKRNQ